MSEEVIKGQEPVTRAQLEADKVLMFIAKDPADSSDVIFALNDVMVTQVKRGEWVKVPRYKAEMLQSLQLMHREQSFDGNDAGKFNDTFQPKYNISIKEMPKHQ